MAEYYAVLSRAVASLEANSADTRRAVYDKARNALIGQLKAIDPPLPTAEISRQRLELEEAIRRVERETSTVPTGAPVRVVGAKRQAPAEQPPRPSPQDVFRRAIQEAERGGGEAQRMERAPVTARADDWSSDHVGRPVDRPPPAKPVPQYLPSQGYVEEAPRNDEPRLAPDYDYEWDPDAAQKAPPPRVSEPQVDSRDRGDRDRLGSVKPEKRGKAPRKARRGDADMGDPPVRQSRLPTILLLVLIIAMLGGLGALGWSQRTVIADLLGQFDSKAPPSTAASTKPPAADASSKDTDRLLPGQTAASSGTDVRVVAPPTDSGTSASPGILPDTATPPATTTQTTAAADPDSLVAQRATLYEEPLDQAAAASGVVAINSAVTWSFGQGPEGPEIVANIDVPERKLKIKFTIRRNSDQTLPASHVVEVILDVPAGFPGKGIRDVPRIVLKPAEDARGQPLIGASAKVADGFYWIALSGEAQDVNANLSLLKQRGWIDLPLVYETGQRAIVTFEKGTPGERVFEKALAAWAAPAAPG